MTNEEKLSALRAALSPDTDTDEVLLSVLELSADLIRQRMYPFGSDSQIVPTRYERIQIALAVELYNHRGAEGQNSHGENGISRSWPEKSRLLSMITPFVGSVVTRA